MASSAVDKGTGATLAIANTTWDAGVGAATLQILSMSWTGMERGSIETTHLTTTAATAGTNAGGKTYIPEDYADPGSLEVEGHLNPDAVPPLNHAQDTLTLTFQDPTDAAGATWAASAFCTSFSTQPISNSEVMKFNATFKMSGLITITADAG